MGLFEVYYLNGIQWDKNNDLMGLMIVIQWDINEAMAQSE